MDCGIVSYSVDAALSTGALSSMWGFLLPLFPSPLPLLPYVLAPPLCLPAPPSSLQRLHSFPTPHSLRLCLASHVSLLALVPYTLHYPLL